MTAAASRRLHGPLPRPPLPSARVAELVARHGDAFRHILSRLPRRAAPWVKPSAGWGPVRQTFRQGELRVDVRSPNRRGCNRVYLLTATARGEAPFEVVVKHDRTLRETLANHERVLPHLTGALAEATRALHAVEDGWLVMEALDGLEQKEVVAALDARPQLAAPLARSAARLIIEAARKGLTCHDVSFLEGNNCLVDPTSGKVRLIELQSVQPSPLPAGEIAATLLFDELSYAAHLAWDPHPGAKHYAYHLARELLARMPEAQLVQRACFSLAKARTPSYRTDGFEGGDGSALRLRILGPGTISGFRSEVLSPILCEAVRARDQKAFEGELLLVSAPRAPDGSHPVSIPRGIVPLSDPVDPRAWVRFYDREGRWTLKPPLR